MPSSDDDHYSRRSRRKKERSRSGSRERVHSRHKKDSRDREDGRRRKKERSRKRDKRSPSPSPPLNKKTTFQEIEATKNRMKDALAAVRLSEFSESSSTVPDVTTSSTSTAGTSGVEASEVADRHRAIERIETDMGFAPRSFVSTAGQRNVPHMDDGVEGTAMQTEHDKAIFGAISATVEDGPKVESSPVCPGRSRCQLAHPNLSADSKMREEKWLKKWRELRANLTAC